MSFYKTRIGVNQVVVLALELIKSDMSRNENLFASCSLNYHNSLCTEHIKIIPFIYRGLSML